MVAVPTIAFATLGCRTNQAETVKLVSSLAWDLAVVPFDTAADIYVINTCTVTHEADRQSRQLIRRAHRANPQAAIVVTGCAVDYAPQVLADLPGVRLVVTRDGKETLARQVASWYGFSPTAQRPVGPRCGRLAAAPGGEPLAQLVPTRAWLKVSEGCDNSCAFCVIPRVRGFNRSLPAAEILDQAETLARAGYREIVLTGTNIGSYGQGGGSGLESTARGAARGSTLAPLVRSLLDAVPQVDRWRISSIEPIDFPEDLVALWGDPRVCPHLHLCLQSGSDRVLARMRRRYHTAGYAALVSRIRKERPDLALTTDVLVGFPGETDEDFDRTLDFLADLGFGGVHLFPYSDREGTLAATLDDHVPPAVLAERMDRAQAVVRSLQTAYYQSWCGQEVEALVERVGSDHASATSPHYLKLRLPAAGLASNDLVRVRIAAIEQGIAVGVPLAPQRGDRG